MKSSIELTRNCAFLGKRFQSEPQIFDPNKTNVSSLSQFLTSRRQSSSLSLIGDATDLGFHRHLHALQPDNRNL
ncbi:hypothetical protein L1987_38364 [Smallanthus sonchifolius]|uniref:Uncharacterized protein n=1 Tax=Smallanthus sonchifolius TaxID=185202 RepID=A0ACB9HJA9_9ASTR|nr:hypothetical protein L1987_38364 [Smallanthus sonchifolius]